MSTSPDKSLATGLYNEVINNVTRVWRDDGESDHFPLCRYLCGVFCLYGPSSTARHVMLTGKCERASSTHIACAVTDVYSSQLLPQLILNVKYTVYIPKHTLMPPLPHDSIVSISSSCLLQVTKLNVTCNSTELNRH